MFHTKHYSTKIVLRQPKPKYITVLINVKIKTKPTHVDFSLKSCPGCPGFTLLQSLPSIYSHDPVL